MISNVLVRLNPWKDFRIGNYILSALSPAVCPLKVKVIDLARLSVIIVISSLKNNYI